MSYPLVNAAVSKIVYDTQVNTLKDFQKFLSTKIDISDMDAEFSEFLSTLKPIKTKVSSDEESKTKRQPTLFNLFVKDKMALLKVDHVDKNAKEILSMASEAWRSDQFAKFLQDKETIATLKTENPECNNQTLYEKANLKFQENSMFASPKVTKPLNIFKTPSAPKKGKKPETGSESES